MMAFQPFQYASRILHYVSPTLILLYFLSAATVSVCTLQNLKSHGQKTPRRSILCLMSLVMLSYVADASMFLSHAFSRRAAEFTTDSNIYALSSILVWMLLIASLMHNPYPVWYPYTGSWFLTLLVEIILLTQSNGHHRPSNLFESIQLAFAVCRLIILVVLPALLYSQRNTKARKGRGDEESASLLGHMQEASDDTEAAKSHSKYGSIASKGTTDSSTLTVDASALADEDSDPEDEHDEERKQNEKQIEDRLRQDGNWWTYVRGFLIFLPYVWPSKQRSLQLNVIGVVICLLCIRAVNVLVPYQIGKVVNALTSSRGRIPLLEISLYVLYTCGEYIHHVKNLIWLPMEQYTERSILTAAYNHIMRLSSDFHDSKNSGELIVSINQGEAIKNLLDYVFFQTVPTLIDLIVAYTYLYYLFDAYMALIVGATTIIYLWASVHVTSLLSDTRRRTSGLRRKEGQVMHDTISNWATVSYFSRGRYEEARYSSAVSLRLKAEQKTINMGIIAWSAQNLVLDVGLWSACFLAAYNVANGTKSVGSFVTLLTYWGMVTGPISSFANTHRRILGDLIEAEQLLRLFQRKPTINDGSKAFVLKAGRVEFNNVCFSYDGKKEILEDLTFCATPGQTIALVGETGGGKSTILKLLFRFYDVNTGSVIIDGQDVRDVTLESLRECVGVVPQQPVLFNDTIMSNVRYSKFDATDDEVMEACKAAAVHNKIMSFTNGYLSKVGERGIKLSGGEMQRIAIARAILMDPKIVLLDEATSSVDVETEMEIQKAFKTLTAGRTTFVVAHNLSTVMDADITMVIGNGTILERGSPKQLLKAKGRYFELWSKQMGIKQNIMDSEPIASESSRSNSTVNHCSEDLLGDYPVEGGTGLISSLNLDTNQPYQGFFESSGKGKKIWKPDAPEFVPKSLRGSPTEIQPPHQHHGTGFGQTRGEALSDSKGDQEKKKRGRRRKGEDEPPICTTGTLGEIITNVKTGDQPNAPKSTNEEALKGTELKAKKNRFNRRKQSRSEPAGSGLDRSQRDGSSEVKSTPDGSGEGLSNRNDSRRVSASNEQSSVPASLRASTYGQRRRRRGHWKVKNRDSSNPSGIQSTGASTNWSTDTSVTPAAPCASPSNGINAESELEKSNSGNGVRFAPGF